MEDFPWLYVVMIFIAFVSWVKNRISDASEYRRSQREARARRRRAQETPPTPYQETRHEPEEVPRSFQDIFEELERQFEVEIEEPAPTPGPPPLPSRTPEPEPEPPHFPTEITAKPIAVAPPMGGQKKRRSHSGNQIVSMLRDSGNLKNALVLKELLDKPKALRTR